MTIPVASADLEFTFGRGKIHGMSLVMMIEVDSSGVVEEAEEVVVVGGCGARKEGSWMGTTTTMTADVMACPQILVEGMTIGILIRELTVTKHSYLEQNSQKYVNNRDNWRFS